MTALDVTPHECPDCGDPLVFAFRDTAGVGAHKRGDAYNTTPDTNHYVCWACAKAWKQRLTGPLTPDIVGQLALFTCRQPDCGRSLAGDPLVTPELRCEAGHRFAVHQDSEGLRLEPLA